MLQLRLHGRVYDATLVERVQSVGDIVDPVAALESRYPVLKVFPEPFHLLPLHVVVIVEVRLVLPDDGVALRLYGLIGLEHGEVELCVQGRIAPHLPYLIVEKLALSSRQEEYYHRYGDKTQHGTCGKIPPVIILDFIELAHGNVSLKCYHSAKIQKKRVILKKK